MPSAASRRGETGLRLAAQLGRFDLALRFGRSRAGQELRQDRRALPRPVRAAPRDLDGGLDRLGQIGEQLRHLRGALEIMLGAQAPPLIDGDIASLGDAEERVMRLEIVWRSRSKARWSRRSADGRHRQARAGAARPPSPAAGRAAAARHRAGRRRCSFSAARRARARSESLASARRKIDDAFGAAGERDEALAWAASWRMRGDHLPRLGGGEIGVAGEPHQIGVALGILGEQRDAAIGGRAPSSALSGRASPSVAKLKDRVQPTIGWMRACADALGEFERAEQIVGVGERQRRHAAPRRPRPRAAEW